MRIRISAITTIVLLIFAFVSFSKLVKADSVQIFTSPAGGEQWPIGSTQTIRWNTTGLTNDNYDLVLISVDSTFAPDNFAEVNGTTGAFLWQQVGKGLTIPTGQYEIQMQSSGGSSGDCMSTSSTGCGSNVQTWTSNPFTITAANGINSSPITTTSAPGTTININGTIYMIAVNGTQKLPYTSAGAFLSYSYNSWAIVQKPQSGDLLLPTGNPIPPRDGSIICSDRGTDTGTCYLISVGTKIGFPSEQVFTGQGFSFSKALYGDTSFLKYSGNIQSATQTHSAGVLINEHGTVYLLSDNYVIGIPNIAILSSWGYTLSDVIPANSADEILKNQSTLTMRIPGQLSISQYQ